jgi:polynucleotide 5'-kinase involved in rRNA processing
VGDSTARIRLASKRYGGASPEALPPSDAAFDESVALRCSPQQQQQSFELVQSPVATAAAPLAGSAQPLDLCQEWRQAAAGLASRDTGAAELVIVVVGSKQTGKSTFARLLVNSLLNRAPLVAYLDTDCGQSEFTAPGAL